MSEPARDVADCLAGSISAQTALSRLVLAGLPPEAIAALLPPHTALARLFAAQRDNIAATARMLAEARVDHGGAQDATAIASMFDRAVAAAPDASVAAYSLNDPALLAGATAEVVAWLLDGGLATDRTDVLDLGCGTGRVAAGLAPHVRSVLGLDVSAGMVAEARRRHGGLANLRFEVTDGAPSAWLPADSAGLVLAVDSFPYLVQAGLADAHVCQAARVLRPGGALVILNLSYGEADQARADRARGWASACEMQLDTCAARPFTLWDGEAYVLRRTATIARQDGATST